jgi:DNA-binding CsgD family transcriptional regulator
MLQGSLSLADVRGLLQLLGELRELGAPEDWRRHLAQSLETLCGARAVLVGELLVLPPVASKRQTLAYNRNGVKVLHRELRGVSGKDQPRFDEEVIWGTHGPNETISGQWSRYRDRFTASRNELVSDRVWYRSELANEHFRAFDCDDFIVHMLPVPAFDAVASIKLFRAWGDRPFSTRDGMLIDLLGEELARDFGCTAARPLGLHPRSSAAAPRGPALPRRHLQVLTLLAAGASEKEIADALSISAHTVHDYTKALYRTFGVHSRAELLARHAKPCSGRARLISESRLDAGQR